MIYNEYEKRSNGSLTAIPFIMIYRILETAHSPLAGRWLMAIRMIWLILAIMAITLWILGTIENSTRMPETCPQGTCDPFALSTGDLAALADLDLPVDFIAGFFVMSNIGIALTFFAIGGAIAWRKSDDRMGLLVSFTLIYLGSIFFTDSDDALWRAYPASRPFLTLLGMVGYAGIMLLLFYFPDGRFVPHGRASRIVGWLIILLTAPFAGSATRADAIGTFSVLATIGLGLATQIHRYRKVSGPEQRQQTKWVLFGLATSLAVMLLWGFAAVALPPGSPSLQRVYFLLFTRPLISILIPMLPLAIALSILRYRLWDIDILINKTLVYGGLTGMLGLVYFGCVVLLQQIFPAESPIAVALSTLTIAAAFSPLRRRIQGAIDRRFYRRKYDAQKTLAAFSARMPDEVELERLSETLLAVVEEALQPAHVSIWLRENENNSRVG